jgi:predicted nicotinamide N-methyase
VISINETDLVSGLYEGGLKIWDCSIDLVNYLGQNPELAKDKKVLELGCGQGLPGIMALRHCNADMIVL